MPPRSSRRRLTAYVLASALAGTLACASSRVIVIGTARAPSASGYVEVDGTTKTTTKVVVHLEFLHRVDSLDPALHAYVVWFENGKNPPVRGGSLTYDPEKRKGELKAVSPYRKFVVKVTAEANDTPSAPSDFVVATQDVSTLD
jgi:hypothetical protein